MTFAAAIILVVITVYVIKITQWLHYWRKLPLFQPSQYVYVPLSVVVAFRNEAHNIGILIECLRKQNYPPQLFEVILVDDHSGDGSAEIVREKIKDVGNFKCIANNRQPGKKGALITGIEAAGNEFIVTTDADAYLSPDWLAVSGSFYSICEPALIIAPVNINSGNSLIQRFFSADFISLIASGAGAAASGKPVFCNGANLAFRKSAFMKCKDAMNTLTASGDDTFLLHAMKRNKEKILFLKSSAALVEVNAPGNIREFMNQHVRWVSKSRHYSDQDILFTACMVFLANACMVVAFLFMLAGINLWLFVLIFILKGYADYRLMAEFYNYLQRPMKITDFVFFSLIYPVYLIVVVISGSFTGFKWKGRSY